MNKFILYVLLILPIYCEAQDYGIKIIYNLSTHTNYNPEVTEDGPIQWDILPGIGIEVFYEWRTYKNLMINSAFGYQQKGYKEIAQTGIIGPGGTPISNNILSNRINVLALSTDIAYDLILNENIFLSPYLGIELNANNSRSLESEMVWPIYESYPVKNYQDNWKKIYFNYLIGARCKCKNIISIEAGFSRSFTPVMKLDDLIIKDWIWTLKLGIGIKELVKKDNN